MLIKEKLISGILLSCLLLLLPSFLNAQGSEKLIVPHFVAHPEIESYLYIADVEGVGPTVTVNFYSEDGSKLAEERVLVQKYGNATVQPYKVLNRTAVGAMTIISEEGSVVAEYWQLVNRPEEEEMYSVAVPAQPDVGNKVLILQHFVSHPNIRPHIFIADAESKGPVVDIKFFSESGELLKQTRELVPANGTLDINPYKILNQTLIGTAQISSEGGSIVGEYWQIVNRKFTKEEKKIHPDLPEREQYAIAVPLQGAQAAK